MRSVAIPLEGVDILDGMGLDGFVFDGMEFLHFDTQQISVATY